MHYLSPVSSRPLTLGHVGGHKISVHAGYSLDAARRVELVLSLRDVPRTAAQVSKDDIHRGSIGIIRQLENKVQSIPRTLRTLNAELEDHRQERTAIEHRIGQPSPHTNALRAAQARVDDVDNRLSARAEKASSPARRTTPPRSKAPTAAGVFGPSHVQTPPTDANWSM